MDLLNSYGVRLLMPFSDRWFYGDALYIVDPFLYVVLWRRRSSQRATGGATGQPSDAPARRRLRLAVAGALHGADAGVELWARAEVRDGLSRAGRPAEHAVHGDAGALPIRSAAK